MPALLDLAETIGRLVSQLDLHDPEAAAAALDDQLGADALDALDDHLRAAAATGALTPREATPTLRFGRLCKPDGGGGCSVEVVDIQGAGAAHTHPRGEVSRCVPISGAPRFEGATHGWAILPPGSRHVPEVTGGRMIIAYWLPDGAVSWG